MVLLDLHMPGLMGDDLASLLVREGIDVILHSGDEPATLERIVKESGALGYIIKTEDADRFMREFEALLAARSPRPSRPPRER